MQLQLKAHLNAYSRAPFYSDWVRDVSIDGEYDPDIVWVRAKTADGQTYWEPINKYLFNKENVDKILHRLDATEELLDESLSATYITAPYYSEQARSLVITFHNKYGWIDEQGNKQYKQVISIPSAYPDNKTIYKDLHNSSCLTLVNIPDEKTLKTVKTESVITVDAIGNPKEVELGKLRVDGMHIENPRSKWARDSVISGDTLDVALAHHDAELDDLKSVVQGKSGYLDPMPEAFRYENEYIQSALTRWALQQLNLQQEIQIPNNTKILYPEEAPASNRDLYVFVYSESSGNLWKNSGKDVIVEATNDGVLGVVTGTNKKFGVSIVPTYVDEQNQTHSGEMVVNGVEAEFNLVIYKGENTSENNLPQAYIQTKDNLQGRADISQETDSTTLVMRTVDGNIRCSSPLIDEDAINLRWFNNQFMTEDELDEILKEILND